MPRVNITTTDGEQHTVECPGVPSVDIDAAYIEKRTAYSVESAEVDDPDAELADAIQNASNLQELKDALTDSAHPAKSRGNR